MANKELPAPELLRKLIAYNPETGEATWLPRPASMFNGGKTTAQQRADGWNSKYAHKIVGSINARGYWTCTLFKTHYLVHRIVWALHYGLTFPSTVHIDHINHVRTDNRITNLRLVTKAENARNYTRRSDNTSGQVGVKLNSRGHWTAQINISGKRVHLGHHRTKEAAIAARKAAEAKYSFHPNHGG